MSLTTSLCFGVVQLQLFSSKYWAYHVQYYASFWEALSCINMPRLHCYNVATINLLRPLKEFSLFQWYETFAQYFQVTGTLYYCIISNIESLNEIMILCHFIVLFQIYNHVINFHMLPKRIQGTPGSQHYIIIANLLCIYLMPK